MRLSVIIVNYNVRHFLEQALLSVRKALEGIESEVWVVDNNSVDDSVHMVQDKFPDVHLITNKHNPGFSVANNQAIERSKGEYVLLLNPDTLVEEDTFHRCLEFMDAHPDAGALGVKLIDGSGKYLPESKRGFPSPWVAFCKTSGLSSLFPRSKTFNGYYLGHLDENETHEVDVLVGCFMFIRKETLDKSGLLDEAFFMYGEDIDLSYRIKLAGYKNYYFPETQIIHYKGESTKKGSLNYVRTFYQAMIIFMRKHFSGRSAGLFVAMMQLAIWLRAGISLGKNVIERIWLPMLDALLIFVGLVFLRDFWAAYYYKDPGYFKAPLLWFNFPLYTLVWLFSAWLSGAYDARFNLRKLIRGLAFGTLVLAAIYGFLDQEYRPSRALLLLGAAWSVVSLVGFRLLLHFMKYGNFELGQERVKNQIIVGSEQESKRVENLLSQSGVQKNLIGTVAPSGENDDHRYLSNLEQLDEVVRIYRVDELIFCSRDIRSQEILGWMTRLGPTISYKIVPEESLSIIGSSSKDAPGELYTIEIKYNITQAGQGRNKRVFDLVICLFLLPTAPLWLVFSDKRSKLATNWLWVLLGSKSWVGYAPEGSKESLPKIRPGVFSPANRLKQPLRSENTLARLNFFYAKDWDVWRDVEILQAALL
ncbi:MAG: glycosyltransferase [Saprospiraceae bacterium]